MPFTIVGSTNEFGVSTGSNVDVQPTSSRFDGPPRDTTNLLITTKAGDDDPRLFELGDTYDISWSGAGGGGSIVDAVVVRSDPLTGGGVIAFEGLDQNGQLAHVVWTPGMDLDAWYTSNYDPAAEPEFFTEDFDASYNHRFVCFSSEARIRTPHGVKAAGGFRAGDLVTTKDAGDVAVQWVGHRFCSGTGENAPVIFEQGSMGNTAPVKLSQQHRVLIKSPYLQYYFGISEALLAARFCVNDDTIRIAPQKHICYVHLLLEAHHIVWAEGLECESLLLGDQAMKTLWGSPEFQQMQQSCAILEKTHRAARPLLKKKEAQLLMRNTPTMPPVQAHLITPMASPF